MLLILNHIHKAIPYPLSEAKPLTIHLALAKRYLTATLRKGPLITEKDDVSYDLTFMTGIYIVLNTDSVLRELGHYNCAIDS